jgi:hypothetical protein
MNCLKCGKPTENAQVFCADCQQVMENYPVAPGTHVHIPLREPVVQTKASRQKSRGFADSIRMLRKVIRSLCIVIAVLTGIICILTAILLHTLNDKSKPTIGQNYTTVQTETQP